jgi:hypothetical protein
VEKGSLDCFRYIVETAQDHLDKPAMEHFGKSVAIAAAKGAQLGCLEVLSEMGLEWDARATAAAARAGSDMCLHFLVKEGSVDVRTLDAAVESGDTACLALLKNQDWNSTHTAGLAFQDHVAGLNYLFSLEVWIA